MYIRYERNQIWTMELKKIIVGYWHSFIPEAGFKHQEEFEYSTDKRNEIIDTLLAKGLSILLRPQAGFITIWISKTGFGQR